MRDIRKILHAHRALGPNETAALATIVHAEGSTYRRAGARMLVRSDATAVGVLSGGCLEGDLLERAERVRARGEAELVRYDTTPEHDALLGTGLGCRGIVDILIEPVSKRRPGALSWIEACVRARACGALATSLDRDTLGEQWALLPHGRSAGADASEALKAALARTARDRTPRLLETEGRRVALEPIVPPLRFVVIGAGPDAPALVQAASALGWDVTVSDHRSAQATPERFPDATVLHTPSDEACKRLDVDASTYVVVMTHNLRQDRILLRDLFRSEAPYIGLLGSRTRTREILADLTADGLVLTSQRRARLHGPAGLDIGGEGPEAIAVAIVAELLAVSEGRLGHAPGPRADLDREQAT